MTPMVHLLAPFALLVAAEPPAEPPVVLVEPSVVPDGSPILVIVNAPGGVDGKFEGQSLRFRADPTGAGSGHRRTAVAGVPYGAKPGPRDVIVRLLGSRPVETLKATVTVVSGNYPTSIVVTPPRKTAAAKAAAGIRVSHRAPPPPPPAEPGSFARAINSDTKKRLWSGRFLRPVISTVTEPYGTSRLNVRGRRKWRSTHLALDLDGQGGEPVLASNAGIVVAAGHYPGSGNTVIVDHGDRLLSLYFHNERLHVKRGDRVKRGTAIADIGATGRVTGPHLHFEFRVNGFRVSPEAVIDLVP